MRRRREPMEKGRLPLSQPTLTDLPLPAGYAVQEPSLSRF